MQNNQIPALP